MADVVKVDVKDFVKELRVELSERQENILELIRLRGGFPWMPHRTEELILQNDTLQQMLEAGKMKVLAICHDADYAEWMAHPCPANWLCGYDLKGQINDEMLYEIRQYPSIYLLDREKHVQLKEADYELVCRMLFGRSQ